MRIDINFSISVFDAVGDSQSVCDKIRKELIKLAQGDMAITERNDPLPLETQLDNYCYMNGFTLAFLRKAHSRKRKFTEHRQILYYVLTVKYNMTAPRIADILQRHRGSVHHGLAVVEGNMKIYADWKKRVEASLNLFE